MKIQNFLQVIGVAFVAPFLVMGVARAETFYFDQNGTETGFGITGGTTYDWGDGAVPPVWNSHSSGGVGTMSAWNNLAGDTASFGSSGNLASWGVNLTSDIRVGGIALTSAIVSSDNYFTISSAVTRTLTLAPGAQIAMNQGAGRRFLIGNNVNLSGNVNLTSTSTAAQAANFAIEGTGALYSGTITTSGNVIVTTHGASRFGKNTKLVLNTGGVLTSHSATATLTIGELSGNGGALNRTQSNYTIAVDQDTTTAWSGQMATSSGLGSYKFLKSGTGTLVLDGSQNHHITQSVSVMGGSLYVKANLAETTNAANGVIVGGSGNFGGSTTTSKHVTLQTSGSQLTAGMYDVATGKFEAAQLTLANGLTASNGGTFNFAFNGTDDLGETLNSTIRLTGGTFSLAGTKTANFFDLGTGDIQAGTAYTIFTAAGITTDGWVFGSRPIGWEFDSFSVVGNDLRVTFSAVPEPSAALLALASGAVVLVRRRFRKCH